MIAWLRKARQTRTPVHDQSARQRERIGGLRLAYQALGAIQLLCQLLLWIILYGYDALQNTVWQAALGLLIPALALWLIWRPINLQGATQKGLKWALGLLPCLMLDGYLLLLASCSLMADQIPDFPLWTELSVIVVMMLATVWLSRENGVPYGAYTMRYLLLAFFVLSTFLLGVRLEPQRLWPLNGDGLTVTAAATLGGSGAIWGLALVGLFPKAPYAPSPKRPGATFMLLLPMALSVVWALWLALIAPWRSGEGLTVGQRLTEMSQFSYSALLCESAALFWMLMLPFGLLGTLNAGTRLLQNAFPKTPRTLWAAALLLPMVAGVALAPEQPPPFMASVLPWRFALSALTGAALRLNLRKERSA